MNEEQRAKWNKYFKNYQKKKYKSISIRLDYEHDKELLDYLESQDRPIAIVIKNLIKEKLGK